MTGIAWYYGDSHFIAHSDAAHVTCSMDSRVTCSTDTDSCVTCGINAASIKLHAAARLPH